MKTYVLGAGASAHAAYPLVSKLWGNLAKWIRDTKPVDNDYRVRVAQIEDGFSEEVSNFEKLVTVLDERLVEAQDAGQKEEKVELPYLRHFLEAAICEFFDALRQRRSEPYNLFGRNRVQPGDVVITFNYDVSLDRELKEEGKWEVGNGYGFNVCAEQTPHSPVMLLKLHGSTNWRGQLFNGARGGQAGQATNSLGIRPVIHPHEFEFLGYKDVRDSAFKGGGFIHSLIMPSLAKEFYVKTSFGREWERFWDRLWEQAADALQRTDEMVIHGYSLSAADIRARDLILTQTSRKAAITVCCRSQSERIAKEFREKGFESVSALGNTTFEQWVRN